MSLPHEHSSTDQPESVKLPAAKKRFRIVKLEERIAPGNGRGNGSNATCGNLATCQQNHCDGSVFTSTSIF